MSKTTEAEFAKIVIEILEDWPNGEAMFAELFEEIPQRHTLSSEDLMPSPTRPGEPVWHQQVRNITSHKASPGNAVYEGKLVAVSGGLALPAKEKAA